jgi:phosphopantetheinyl transferase (holo-ACP synthase)
MRWQRLKNRQRQIKIIFIWRLLAAKEASSKACCNAVSTGAGAVFRDYFAYSHVQPAPARLGGLDYPFAQSLTNCLHSI